jgi:AraC family transcriptional regulator, regulatory protein of adaptative response / methylated-DNA-[protein]-cysteine methyltransferase
MRIVGPRPSWDKSSRLVSAKVSSKSEIGLSVANEAAWDAVLRKDRHYDGKFVYAAVTTGIYCRPSCPARNPQRRNTLIFWTVAEAETQGYTACLRCHPNSLAPAEKSIKAALDYIEAHLDHVITLNTLSQVSGLSPHHLQETFKRIVGLSPKSFCDARRIARFKQHLRAGQSISGACYEVGYGSSRALYEKTKKGLGMTPAVYRRGGKGVRVCYAIADSALGSVLVAGTEQGLCAVLLGEDEDLLVRELREEFPNAVFRQEPSRKWRSAVQTCQIEDALLLKLPMSLRGRIFEARVWHILQ